MDRFCKIVQESQTPPKCMHGLILAEFHYQSLGISRMTSSSQQHVLLAGVFKRVSNPVFFLLHTCVTFFSGLAVMVIACEGTQVK